MVNALVYFQNSTFIINIGKLPPKSANEVVEYFG